MRAGEQRLAALLLSRRVLATSIHRARPARRGACTRWNSRDSASMEKKTDDVDPARLRSSYH
jgi:hypothetical protein